MWITSCSWSVHEENQFSLRKKKCCLGQFYQISRKSWNIYVFCEDEQIGNCYFDYWNKIMPTLVLHYRRFSVDNEKKQSKYMVAEKRGNIFHLWEQGEVRETDDFPKKGSMVTFSCK